MIKKIKSLFRSSGVDLQNTNFIQSYNAGNQNKSIDNNNYIWQNNPYKFYSNTVASAVERLATYISTLQWLIVDNNDEIVKNNTFQTAVDLLQNPSERQPTYQQLIYDMAISKIFNNTIYCVYDVEKNKLTCLKEYELSLHSIVTDDIIPKRITWVRGQARQVDFILTEKGHYQTQDEKMLLFASELIFERNPVNNSANMLYSKNIFTKIWASVYLEYVILNKNTNLTINKNDAGLALISAKDNNISLSKEVINQIQDKISAQTNKAQNNGTTESIFCPMPIDIQKAELNNLQFNTQFENLLTISRKDIYTYLKIPFEMVLEQAKFTNNVTMQISYLENAVQPQADYIFSFLKNILSTIFDKQGFNIIGDYKNTVIYQDYLTDVISKQTKYITVNEARKMIGHEPLEEGGDRLIENSNFLNKNLDNEGQI